MPIFSLKSRFSMISAFEIGIWTIHFSGTETIPVYPENCKGNPHFAYYKEKHPDRQGCFPTFPLFPAHIHPVYCIHSPFQLRNCQLHSAVSIPGSTPKASALAFHKLCSSLHPDLPFKPAANLRLSHQVLRPDTYMKKHIVAVQRQIVNHFSCKAVFLFFNVGNLANHRILVAQT